MFVGGELCVGEGVVVVDGVGLFYVVEGFVVGDGVDCVEYVVECG